MKEYKIASIAGDGIGKEVTPEGIRVLKKVADNINLKFILMNLTLLLVIIMQSMEPCARYGKTNW